MKVENEEEIKQCFNTLEDKSIICKDCPMAFCCYLLEAFIKAKKPKSKELISKELEYFKGDNYENKRWRQMGRP